MLLIPARNASHIALVEAFITRHHKLIEQTAVNRENELMKIHANAERRLWGIEEAAAAADGAMPQTVTPQKTELRRAGGLLAVTLLQSGCGVIIFGLVCRERTGRKSWTVCFGNRSVRNSAMNLFLLGYRNQTGRAAPMRGKTASCPERTLPNPAAIEA